MKRFHRNQSGRFRIHIKRTKPTLHVEALIFFFLLIWFFEPSYFSENAGRVHTLFIYMRELMVVMVLVLTLLDKKVKWSNPTLYITLLMGFCLLLSTLMNYSISLRNGLVSFLNSELTLIGIVVLFNYMINRNALNFIRALLLIYELLLIVNLATVFAAPDGLYNTLEGTDRHYWFLGHQNQIVLYSIPGMAISLFYSKYVVKSEFLTIRTLGLLAVVLLTILSIWSATGIVGYTIFTVIILLGHFKKLRIDLKWGLLGSVLVFIVFVILGRQIAFKSFIEIILRRDITFSNRIMIWSLALALIARKPWMGYGLESYRETLLRFSGFYTPHNRYLYLVYRGGIVLAFLFLIIIVVASAKIKKNSNTILSVFLSGCIFSFLIMMNFESYASAVFYVPIILSLYLDEFIKQDRISDSLKLR